ncbi:MAG: hypothetical protein CMM76_13615 [Rhodospirillaceae bacterium]|nr:hypothetical protein [Rhodospirillaceae bacterium]|tara:strand:- start:947 stop:1147 length:201 start_codon:yes stop_codon:yes gene_type:complete
METITITEAHVVVFGADGMGSETIINLLKHEVLDLPEESAKGKTGKDIGWLVHKDAKITEDFRHEP